MALMDDIASAKARVENLNTCIQEHRTRKQEYTSFLSQQYLGNKSLFLLFFLPANVVIYL